MSAIASLMRSLYSLTGISYFNSAANAIYEVSYTKNQVKRVQNDAQRAKGEFDKVKNKKTS